MAVTGFILEKARHGELSSSEIKVLAVGYDRLLDRLAACAQEVARRDEADALSRKRDRERGEKLRQAVGEVERLRPALEHEKQRREVKVAELEDRVRELTGIMRDIHYGLLYQPEHSREELAGVLEREVGSHPRPLGT